MKVPSFACGQRCRQSVHGRLRPDKRQSGQRGFYVGHCISLHRTCDPSAFQLPGTVDGPAAAYEENTFMRQDDVYRKGEH